MIGKYARGFRHLKRVVGNSKTKRIFIIQNGRILDSEGFVCPLKERVGDALVLFQNMGGSNDLYKIHNDYRQLGESLLSKYHSYYIVNNSGALMQLGRKFFIVDDNFDELYEEFQKNNKKLLEQVYGKYCYSYDSMAMFMFALIGNSPNLYVWALTNYFKNSVSLFSIEHIINWHFNYSQLTNKLSKGTITAYNGRDKVNKLLEEIVKLRSVKRANDSINSFNTQQKKLLKSIELNDKNIHILNRFGRLSKVKKRNFIRKMSTIDDINDIMHQMSLLSNIHFEWNRNSLMDYINNTEDIKCDIVYDDKNIVLVKVNTYDTVKSLAKTTNWCISKNKRYWNDYVEHRRDSSQYVMFDFNKPEDHELSIVGFTSANNNGITNAHSFSNKNLMNGYNGNRKLTSFFTVKEHNNIFSILQDNKIPLQKILNNSKLRYNWDLKSFLSFLPFCIDENEYDIHYINEDENILVFSTKNKNIKYIIPNRTISDYTNGLVNFKCFFVFMDFNKDEDNSDRIKYSIIYNDNSSKEEYGSDVYDAYGSSTGQSFNNVLEEFDLPYDIICRTNDVAKCFEHAFRNYDIKTVRNLISNKEIINRLKEDRNSLFNQTSGSVIYDSIFNFKSFDYIDLIYENDYSLMDIISKSYLNDLLNSLAYEINNYYRHFGHLPTEKDYNDFANGSAHFNERQTFLLFFFKVFNTIVSNEKKNKGFNKYLENVLVGTNPIGEFKDYLLENVIENMSFNKSDDKTRYVLRTIAAMQNEKYNEIILNKNINKDCAKHFCMHLNPSAPLYKELIEKYGSTEQTSETSYNMSDLLFTYTINNGTNVHITSPINNGTNVTYTF